MLDGVMVVNLYTGATPHSIAAILPAQGLAHAQAFRRPEAIAAISGLTWATPLRCSRLREWITRQTCPAERCSIPSTGLLTLLSLDLTVRETKSYSNLPRLSHSGSCAFLFLVFVSFANPRSSADRIPVYFNSFKPPPGLLPNGFMFT